MFVVTSTIDKARDDLDKLLEARSFQDVTKSLILLSSYLPEFYDAQKTQANEVDGCETQTWIVKNEQEQFAAYSSSKIMRGLLFTLIASAALSQSYDLSRLERQLSESKKAAFNRLAQIIVRGN